MKFANDKAMLTFALQTLQTSNDADDLICSNENTLNRKDLKHTSDGKFRFSHTKISRISSNTRFH